MSFNNRNYNTRNSGRFNVPGNFVPASSTNHQTYEVPPPAPPTAPPAPPAPLPPSPAKLLNPVKVEEVEMWAPPPAAGAAAEEPPATGSRHPFFKTKLGGVRKISNKERRRRQNALLRRITSPKNALMCINEMLPNEQITNQFKVEAAQDSFYSRGPHNFRAELVLDGVTYRGHGENKLVARNAAAEQAIRDIVLKKMERYSQLVQNRAPPATPTPPAEPAAAPAPAPPPAAAPAPAPGGAGGGAAAAAQQAMDTMMEEEGEGEEALPMIQLLSFALHKLFAEWEGAGHHVPQLRASRPAQCLPEEDITASPPPPPPRPPMPRKVPDNASSMHPGMLLTTLRPQAAYRELSAEGDKPQNMIFTIAIEIDGQTFIGKASSKKEARKAAARAACKELIGITFDDEKPHAN